MSPYDAHLHGVGGPTAGCLAAGDPAELESLPELARAHGLHLALGVHPWWAHTVDTAAVLEHLEDHPLDAVGELGLDRLRGDLEAQTASARLQLDWAARRDLPVVLHCVRAHAALLDLLPAHQAGLVHAWTGSPELADRFVRRGLHLSFGRALLRSPKVARAAATIPADRLLVESDGIAPSPDLPPVIEHLASIRGWSVDDTVRRTYENARALFPRAPRGLHVPAPAPGSVRAR